MSSWEDNTTAGATDYGVTFGIILNVSKIYTAERSKTLKNTYRQASGIPQSLTFRIQLRKLEKNKNIF